MTSYKIKEGECLSLIAQKFNVDLKKLQELNSEQIKNIDLIYAGSVIDVSVDNKPGIRKELPAFPECKGDQCSTTEPDFVDILYVPAHPETGKRTWYGLTKEAQEAIIAEQQNLSDAIVKDKITTLQNLNKLGLLSIFNHCPYEMFLNEKETQRYRTLLFWLTTIRSGSADAYKPSDPDDKGGLEGFVIAVATEEDMDTEKLQKRYYNSEKAKLARAFNMGSGMGGGAVAIVQLKYIEALTKQEAFIARVAQKLVKKVTRHLEKEIRKLERTAIRKSGDIKTEDGTRFVFDEKENYFTSQQQKTVQLLLKTLEQSRQYTDDNLALTSHSTATETLQYLWGSTAGAAEYLSKTWDEQEQSNQIPPLPIVAYFTQALLHLNGLGYVVKEQCLTMAELEGTSDAHLGPKAIRDLGEWRDKQWLSGKAEKLDVDDGEQLVKALSNELARPFGIDESTLSEQALIQGILAAKGNVEWAFYPCLAIVKLVDATVTQWTKDLQQLLDNNMPAPQMLRMMLWVKKLALARINFLKEEATHRARKGERLQYLYLKQDDAPKSFHLLWEEEKFKPREKRLKVFYAKNGKADLRAVECVLLSTGKVQWVRTPAWYLPEETKAEKRAAQFIRNITQKVEVVGPAATKPTDITIAKTLPEALDAAKKVLGKGFKNVAIKHKFALNALNIAKSVSKDTSAFWQASYHWQDGVNPDGKNGSGYVVDAEAQFMRLTTKAEGTLNLPLSDIEGLTPNLDLSGDVSLGVDLTLLSGQVTIDTWFPLSKAGGKQLNRPAEGYKYTPNFVADDGQGGEVTKEYPVGEFFLRCTATAYGLAAASCQLSASLAFGQSSTDGEIGVKGKSLVLQDYNEPIPSGHAAVRVKENPNALTSDNKLAGQGSAGIDLFAGVEAGGNVSAKAYWRPPAVKDSTFDAGPQDLLELGSICTQLGVNAGVGFSGELRIAFEGGVMYLIAAAKVVCGPGVSGKVSVAFNPINADRLIDHLLNMLKQTGFKRMEILGERDKKSGRSIDFIELNQRLTLAIQTGLTFGEVLLLPPVAYNQLRTDSQQESYAPVIAGNILDQSTIKKMQSWVKNVPPETLAKLLDCLSNINETHLWQWKETKAKIAADEILKARAINQILAWIKPSGEADKEKRCRQFEKALSLMGSNAESLLAPRLRWQQFNQGWMQLAKFINHIYKESDGNLREINRIRDSLNAYSEVLNSNMRRYHFIPGGPVHSRAEWEVYRVEKPGDSDKVVKARDFILETVNLKESWTQETWEL